MTLKYPTEIIIFSKKPEQGQVKTRLIPALGEQKATQLAEHMLVHTARTVNDAINHYPLLSGQLCVSPDQEDSYWQRINHQWHFTLANQVDGDLGKKMFHAAREALENNKRVIILGTDCPTINYKLIYQVASFLNTSDAVFVPTFDGGYVMIGLRKVDPLLFSDISWSTDRVLDQSLERCGDLGYSAVCLEQVYDIDEEQDLEKVPEAWL